MPVETKAAIEWSLSQTVKDDLGLDISVSKKTPSLLVDMVREYFNNNNVGYNNFSFEDLEPYLI